MEISTSTWMLLFFIFFLIISILKIWAFLPNKQLVDDDTTEEATLELQRVMLNIIQEKKGKIDEKELFLAMTQDENFNSQLFWRFNLNRLKQLLNAYYLNNPQTKTIEDIYNSINS